MGAKLRYLPGILFLCGAALCLGAVLGIWRAAPEHELVILRDISASLHFGAPAPLHEYIKHLNPDRLHVIDFAAQAHLATPPGGIPGRGAAIPAVSQSLRNTARTNIQAGIELAGNLPRSATRAVRRRVLLISDGQQNAGDGATTARRYARGMRLDALAVGEAPQTDARVESINLPGRAAPGEEFAALIRISATRETPLTAGITGPGGDVLAAREAITSAAGTELTFLLRAGDAQGMQTYEAFVSLPDDQVPQNDRARAALLVQGGDGILWLGGDDSAAPYPGLPPIRRIPPQSLSAAELAQCRLLVLENVPAPQLTPHIFALERFLQNGGGLLVIGGERSLAAGGWENTALARLLPVEVIPGGRQAVAFGLDVSGSMGEPVQGRAKLALAASAIEQAVRGLGSRELAGLVSFTRQSSLLLPLRKPEPAQFAAALQKNASAGGTSIFAGIAGCASLLEDAPRPLKTILLLTDGDTQEEGQELETELARTRERLIAAGIRLEIIAVGEDPQMDILNRLTEGIGGVTLASGQMVQLPQVLSARLRERDAGFLRENLRVLTGEAGQRREERIARTLEFGPLRQRPGDRLLLSTTDGIALAALGRHGLGRVAVFGGTPWGDWRTGGWGEDIFRHTLRELTGSGGEGQLSLRVEADGVFALWWPQESAGGPYYLSLAHTGAERRELLPLDFDRPELWSIRAPRGQPGEYIARVHDQRGRLLAEVPLLLEEREEYLRYGALAQELTALALAGGGELVYTPQRLAPWPEVPATGGEIAGQPGYVPLLAALLCLLAGLAVKGLVP